ncbi:beta transducin [Fusarium acutatum]|uniref:Beta transducin n=1 Tax=Fusarium acutatum TaxID=78861 RepID=A0A8H4NLB3_9HYPO|nr:beta transducin [Fusarium acutatum]
MSSSAALEFPTGFTLHQITSPEELERWNPLLTQLLLSCVNDDPSASSIGFHAPLSATKATEFWSSQSPQLFGPNPRATLFVLARDTTAVGTISLVTHPKETHAHKVEVGKLLVSATERGHGLGRKLMDMAERFAKEELEFSMRLLDANTFEVVKFMNHNVPKYVILSHTWVTGEEVTFQDMQNKKGMERSGYNKIKQACALALENGYGYAWVDTCCIDKTSSAELSEAINSMMSWHERAEICYTYLADVPPGTNILEPESLFAKSRWFERGWTLQELIAPSRLIFVYEDWSVMSERDGIVDLITQITGIDQAFLSAPTSDCLLQSRLHAASIAEKMSWASERKTTRIEDTAYCLLGIFGINMPLLYGEGTNAFLRLQEEIMKRSDDQTLLAWHLPEDGPDESGVLATSPAAFANCKDFIPCDVGMPTPPYQITNKGLRIEMPVSNDSFRNGRYGLLQCRRIQDPTTMIAIPLDSGRNNLIVQPPSYTVFLESLPDNFYIAEVYPPNDPQQPDPRIIMTGTPEDEDECCSRAALVLIESFVNDAEPFVVRILIESAPTKGAIETESHLEATIRFVKSSSGTFFDGVSLASSWKGGRNPYNDYPTMLGAVLVPLFGHLPFHHGCSHLSLIP